MRELYEEVGLVAGGCAPRLVDVVSNDWPGPVGTVVCVFYAFGGSVLREPEIREPDKMDDLRWMTWDEASWLDHFAPFRSLVGRGYRW
jgi:8-oxo-dGTP pyrophosphatase MutT (NUDIX family)